MWEKVISLGTSIPKCFGVWGGVEFGGFFCLGGFFVFWVFSQSPFLLNCWTLLYLGLWTSSLPLVICGDLMQPVQWYIRSRTEGRDIQWVAGLWEGLVMGTLLFGLCDYSKDITWDLNCKDAVSKRSLLERAAVSRLSFVTRAFHSSLLCNTGTFTDRAVVRTVFWLGCLCLRRSCR